MLICHLQQVQDDPGAPQVSRGVHLQLLTRGMMATPSEERTRVRAIVTPFVTLSDIQFLTSKNGMLILVTLTTREGYCATEQDSKKHM